jgi:polyhydroxyalkanoate synthase
MPTHQNKPYLLLNDDFFENVSAYLFKGISKRLPNLPPIKPDQKITEFYDQKLHALIGKFTYFSPGSLATTYFDWLVHLSLSPGKRLELMEDALSKSMRLMEYIMTGTGGSSYEMPFPQDRRFKDKAWASWPYVIYQQSFLMLEQWWMTATSEVRGMTQHHADVLPFLTRQLIDIAAPVNVPFMNPLVVQETIDQLGMNFMKGAKNYFEDLNLFMQEKPPVGAENYKVGKNIAVTSGKVIYQNRLIELIQYSPTTESVYAEPILIVPAWIMKYYILDLSPHNSLVKYLIDHGHTVFMISWKNPDEKDREVGLNDYLEWGIMDAIKVVSDIVPNQRIHGVGYCLGGTLLSIAAANMGHDSDMRLKTVTLLAAQVDFEEAGELLFFIDESQLEFQEDIMWEKGYLDSYSMAGTFYMLRSNDLIWSRIVENYLMGRRERMTDLMAWNADATRMPYKMHSEYLRSLYLNNDLSSGRFKIKDKLISLNNITIPLFAVGTQKDHVAPWQSVYKLHFLTETEITFVLTSGGHNAGIVSEPGHLNRHYQLSTHKLEDKHISHEEWQAVTPHYEGSWWLAWEEWICQHSGENMAPPKMGNLHKGYKPLREAPGKYVRVK